MSYNGETFTYDEIGNPTTYRNKTLSWSHARQLDSFGDIASFKYNANGIRISKTVNGITTKYYLNGNKIISQTDGTDTLFFYYGTDGITGFNHNGTDYFYKKNIQGDIIGIYDSTNTLICKYIYDAWGNHVCRILSNNGEYVDIADTSNYNINSNYITIVNLNPLRYRSYYYDTETGLYYLNSRYYDSELGRFINADSIDNIDTENLNGFNLYMYCANNPIMLSDEDGDSWWKKIFATLAVVVAVVAVVAITVATAGAMATGIAAGIGAAVGAISYTGSIVITGVTTGKWSWSWGNFLGSTFGGAIAGMLSIVAGITTFTTGFISGFSSSIISDTFNYVLNDEKINIANSLFNASLTGLISGSLTSLFSKFVKIDGINSGKGSYTQISKQIYTKLSNKTIFKITYKTFNKMLLLELFNSIPDLIFNY